MTQYIETTEHAASPFVRAWQMCTSQRHGVRRFFNNLKVKLQTALRPDVAPGLPTCISIEITNRCDGGCVLCPVGEGRVGRPLGRMDFDQFRGLIDQISTHATHVGLYNWGDPMRHPQVYDMIRYVAAQGMRPSISTNLHSFNVEDSEELVRTGLDSLGISIHGLTQKTYATYQPAHQLEEVLAKSRAIVEAKRRLGSVTPEIHFMFIVRKDNEHEIPALRQLAQSLGATYRVLEAILNLRLLPYDRFLQPRGLSFEQLRQERLAKMEQWLPANPNHVNPIYRQMLQNEGKMPCAKLMPCRGPWFEMVVSWDGDVNLCCGVFDPKDSVGNVFKTPVKHIWNNSFYRSARRNICNRSRKDDSPTVCHHCPGMLL